jgi:hypothetical protein
MSLIRDRRCCPDALLQGLRQLSIARVQLREQPDVLDGDDSLVGERLEQLDLAVGEGTGLRAHHDHAPDRDALTSHRYMEVGSYAGPSHRREGDRRRSRIGLGIENVKDRPFSDDARRVRVVRDRHSPRPINVVECDDVQRVAIEQQDGARGCAAEACGVLHDCLEDRLHIRR